MINLAEPCTQQAFAKLVGISQPAVSGLLTRGIVSQGQPAFVWLLSYCDHLREMAAGRASNGELDLIQERARLAREQADKVAMANAQVRRELAPVWLIEAALASVARQIAGILEAIPVNLKRRTRNLTSDDLDFITKEIVAARNLAANVDAKLDELLNGDSTDLEGDSEGPSTAGSA